MASSSSSDLRSIDEDARRRFESAWGKGRPEAIEAFLPPKTDPRHLATLEELVLIDLELAWKAASADKATTGPKVEEYLLRFPELDEPTVLRRLLQEEYRVRQLFGDSPTAGEYMARFPAVELATLPEVQPRDTHEAAGVPKSLSFVPGTMLANRYVVEELVGEGGMGLVLRVTDLQLRRELAVKVMKPNGPRETFLVDRFLGEAEICGRLQHPGVVPLHEIGRLDDGRPFFTMKFVRGRTLHALLRERGNPSQDLPRFVQTFAQLCQALAFAHSQGVIHRDLKPENVMVGAFGEMQVMDWGLAKTLDGVASTSTAAWSSTSSASVSDESSTVVTNVAGTPAAATAVGAVLGTLGYMPPEQARGDVHLVDRRSDVFALGAILCEILTGQPAYTGTTSERWQASRSGDLDRALQRLRSSGADAELVAIASNCLSSAPEARPADAGAVANLVLDYLSRVQERLRQAQEERAAAQARATAERRARRVSLMLSAAVLVLFLGVSGWVLSAQIRRQHNDETARVAMNEARRLYAETWNGSPSDSSRFRAALATAVRATDAARGGSEAVRVEAEKLRERIARDADRAGPNRELLASLLDVRQPVSPSSHRVISRGEPTADEQFSAAFRQRGLADENGEPIEAAFEALTEEPPAVLQEIVAGLDAWAAERYGKGFPEKRWQTLTRLATRLDENLDGADIRRDLRRIRFSGVLRRDWAIKELASALLPWTALAGAIGDGEKQLRELVRKVDAKTAPTLTVHSLYGALVFSGDFAGAEALLHNALVANPKDTVLRMALAQLLEVQGPERREQAIGHFEAARSVRDELGVALAQLLLQANQVHRAEAILRDLVARRPSVDAYFYLGDALDDQRRYAEAEAAYRSAIELRPDQVHQHHNLGNVLYHQKRYSEAEASYRAALEIDPQLAVSLANLGAVLCKLNRPVEAEAVCRRALRINPLLEIAYSNLANALEDEKQFSDAEAVYRRALELKPNYAPFQARLGLNLSNQRRFADAIECARRALELDRNLSEAHYSLGVALRGQGLLKDSVAALKRAIELDPESPRVHNSLALTLHMLGLSRESEAACRKAIELDPRFASPHNNLGRALSAQHNYVAAEAAYRRAIELDPTMPEAHNNLGSALNALHRFAEAEAAYRKAISLRPEYAIAYGNLASSLRYQGRFADAVSACRRSIELDSSNPDQHFVLGILLGDQGKRVEAEAAYRKALELRPNYPQALNNLGNNLLAQQRFADALVEFRKAEKLLPNEVIIRNNVQRTERFVDLDRLLPEILAGRIRLDAPGDRASLAEFCFQFKSRPLAAVSFYSSAFRSQPALAAGGHRYNAGCAAAKAATGKGSDAASLSPEECAELSRMAREWLRGEFESVAVQFEKSDTPTRNELFQVLLLFREDPNLACVRHKDAHAGLPEIEQREWLRFWADVDAALANAGGSKR